MVEDFMGKWVARYKDKPTFHYTTKAHLVESDIVDRSITSCGREMHYRTKNGTLILAPEHETCAQCGTEPDL
jgi:hypothetical protein